MVELYSRKNRKGFIKTLEAVVAASIFLIFLLNATPNIMGSDDSGSAVKERLSRHLEALDREGDLRQGIVNRDLESIRSELEDYFSGHKMVLGLSYMDMVDGKYSGEDVGKKFKVNKSRAEKETLRLWVKDDIGIEVLLNEDTVVSNPGEGYFETEVSSYTVDGENQLNITGSGKLFYRIDQYNYMQKGDLPEDRSINSLSYTVAGGEERFQPSELRVHIWR